MTSRSRVPRITRKTDINVMATGRVSWADEVEDALCDEMLAPADDEDDITPALSPVVPKVPGALPQAPGPQRKVEEDAQEEWAEIAEEEEAARELTIAADVIKPCQEEVEKHNVTHIPYRRWCDCCVEGRGIGEQRGRHGKRPHGIPRVGLDYFYITSGSIKKREELKFSMDATGEE